MPSSELRPCRRALRWFAEKGEKLDAGIEDDTRVFWLTAPADLRQRLNYLPREARPEHDLKQSFEAERAGHLDTRRRRLTELKARHETQLQLELDRSDQPAAFKARRRDERQHHIDRVFRDYRDWLDNTQTTEAEPYLQVAAVFTGRET